MEFDPTNRLIVALDVPELKDAERLVDQLKDYCTTFKVGSYLFTSAGCQAIEMIQNKGARVFLDLKYHDIPNTVALAVQAAAKLGVFMCTIHTMGGQEMMQAAVTAIRELKLKQEVKPLLVGVTVLTSLNQEMLQTEIGIRRSLKNQVLALAMLAKASGLDGVVSSPQEIAWLKKECGPDFLVVTPGIRPLKEQENLNKLGIPQSRICIEKLSYPQTKDLGFAGHELTDDQKRTDTPKQALQKGADFIVVGRPIIAAPNPTRAAKDILKEMANGN